MSAIRVPVAPDVLLWAIRRSGISHDRLYRLFPKWDDWISGSNQPTLKQVESVANATHTPIGFFYLPAPVQLPIPIPDFRRMAGEVQSEPSPDLLEVIHSSQLRQSWYREFARSEGHDPLPFISSVTIDNDPYFIAAKIRSTLELSADDRSSIVNFTEMLRLLREKIEDIGVMVYISGIVGSNTHRTLDPTEFRGFALVDEYAPVIFVNGTDTKAAQIFTLIHELAHLWLGSSGLSDVAVDPSTQDIEVWCNKVSAELLVPMAELVEQRHPEMGILDEIKILARFFKVSTLVILRRLYDARSIDYDTYQSTYTEELKRLLSIGKRGSSSGGDYYNSTLVRTGHRFTRAILSSAWEGSTPFTEAMRLLGMKSMDTLRTMSHRLAVYG
ncbi:MAG: ImmA/IrrE family metallo-endopeptidase [Spirochaetia bacterium]